MPASRPARRTAMTRGRVEDGRVDLGHSASSRFPSPLLKPDVQLSRIRLSDRLHGAAHGRRAAFATPHSIFGSLPVFVVFVGIRQSPTVVSFRSMPEVRALPSTGITRLPQYYGPVRLPPGLPPLASVGCDPLPDGSPTLPASLFRRAVPTTPADRSGLHRLCPQPHGLPASLGGRRPRLHFRGLLRLHSRYSPPDRSAAHGGLCHEASTLPVTRPRRSSATGSVDYSPGGSFLH